VPPSVAPRPLFAFHADFWINLHEVLLHESALTKPGWESPSSLAHESVAPVAELSPAEAGPWQGALGYYASHFSLQDSFTDTIMAADRGLAASRSEPALAPGAWGNDDWRAVLERSAPAYRAHFWATHERTDLAYIAAITPLVAAHGASFAKRLSALFETPWPTYPVEVEVAAVVPPFGAETIGEPPFTDSHAPLIRVSSRDAGYAGDSGLEMIFHESSHLLIDRVEELLEAAAKRQGRRLPRRLWHDVLFFTAGRVAKERLGPGYLPYWEKPTMQAKARPDVLPVLEREWQPYIDGKVSLASAVDAVVAAL
jgi:hypothetical protein